MDADLTEHNDRRGIGLLCDLQGNITDVLGDTLRGAHVLAAGRSFFAAVHSSNRRRAADFVRTVARERAAFGAELAVFVGGHLIGLRFCGGAADDRLLLLGLLMEDILRYKAVAQILNEQSTMLRAALKAVRLERCPRPSSERALRVQISQLGGELTAARQELATKDEELQRLRVEMATLEAAAVSPITR
jgi:hypothetical protein